jgi:hypothetical protein
LVTDRGLREVQPSRRLGKTASFRDSNKRAQEGKIEVHGREQ